MTVNVTYQKNVFCSEMGFDRYSKLCLLLTYSDKECGYSCSRDSHLSKTIKGFELSATILE